MKQRRQYAKSPAWLHRHNTPHASKPARQRTGVACVRWSGRDCATACELFSCVRVRGTTLWWTHAEQKRARASHEASISVPHSYTAGPEGRRRPTAQTRPVARSPRVARAHMRGRTPARSRCRCANCRPPQHCTRAHAATSTCRFPTATPSAQHTRAHTPQRSAALRLRLNKSQKRCNTRARSQQRTHTHGVSRRRQKRRVRAALVWV